MKKIFWTSIFWIVVVAWFWAYIRLFDQNLGNNVARFFVETDDNTGCVVTVDSWINQDQAFLDIQEQLSKINDKLEIQAEQNAESNDNGLLRTTEKTSVNLYYFNQAIDQKLAPEQQINVASILPIKREIPASKNIIEDTINLLIKGSLTKEEKEEWFITEFGSNASFRLKSAILGKDWTLTLEFTDVPWFTSGGSARMLILANSIIKTVEQFDEVKKVVISPDTLFQP